MCVHVLYIIIIQYIIILCLVEPHIREQLEASKNSAMEEVVRHYNHISNHITCLHPSFLMHTRPGATGDEAMYMCMCL
jgi:hypothetical protein